MLPTEDLFVYVYAIVDDAIKAAAMCASLETSADHAM